jgi:hypothetical protein
MSLTCSHSLPSQEHRLTIPRTGSNYIFTVMASLVHLGKQCLFMLPFSNNGFSVQWLLFFCRRIIISVVASVVLVSTVARWSSHYIISFSFLLEMHFFAPNYRPMACLLSIHHFNLTVASAIYHVEIVCRKIVSAAKQGIFQPMSRSNQCIFHSKCGASSQFSRSHFFAITAKFSFQIM